MSVLQSFTLCIWIDKKERDDFFDFQVDGRAKRALSKKLIALEIHQR